MVIVSASTYTVVEQRQQQLRGNSGGFNGPARPMPSERPEEKWNSGGIIANREILYGAGGWRWRISILVHERVMKMVRIEL